MGVILDALGTLLTSSYVAENWQSDAVVHLGPIAFNVLKTAATNHCGHAPAVDDATGGFWLLGIVFVTP